MPLFRWFLQNAYGQYAARVFIAIGSAVVTMLLSLLPHDTLLQAIWMVIASLFMGFFVLRQRLNETDDVRYRRLFRSRFAYLERADPEALTTVFAENIRPRVLDWFASEYDIPIRDAKNIDALDSLARSGDKPAQLIFRTGAELGQWLGESENHERTVSGLEKRIDRFVENNLSLLGDELAEGIYLRHIRNGEKRPVGIHLFSPRSRCLFTIEEYEGATTKYAMALSLKSHLFEESTDEQWDAFKQRVQREFPFFNPARGGSGPRKKSVPLFVSPITDGLPPNRETVKAGLLKLMESIEPTTPESDQSEAAADTKPEEE